MANARQEDKVRRFGPYWLLRCLGSSGNGEHWLGCRADDLSERSICAIKRPRPNTLIEPESLQRFVDEVRITDLLDHPVIGHVLDAGSVDGEPYFVLEYTEGKSLAHCLRTLREMGKSFPLPLAIHLGIKVCGALAYAHRLTGPGGRPLHLVHRDVCPSSLIIAYAGYIKLIDFGKASSRLREAQTMPGRKQLEDVTYQSPEYLNGKPVDGRSDVFSLGVVLWELCSGISPEMSRTDRDVWLKSGRARFVSPSKHRKGVPPQLDYIIMRAVSSDPRERYQSAEELGRELKALLEQLAPGWEQNAQLQMSQFMRSMFESVWLDERRRTLRALQSVQKKAAARARRREEAAEEPEEMEPGMVELIGDDEMDSFDESEPFTAPGIAAGPRRRSSKGSDGRRRSSKRMNKVHRRDGTQLDNLSPEQTLEARKDLLRVFGMVVGLSLLIAVALIVIWSLVKQ